MSLRLAIIGANPANVEEIREVVVASLGCDLDLETATLENYLELDEADLYVCLINRKQQMEDFFSPEKVVALEFVPPTEYFVALSRIPVGTHVVIFNNSTSGTQVLMDRLKRYDLMHLDYEVVAYAELAPAAVAAKLAVAKVITGTLAFVAPGCDLYQKFGGYLPPDVQVLVSPQRIATSDSVSRLCRAFSRLYHEAITAELKRIAAVDYLTQLPNRRTFDEVFRREWNRARRNGSLISLAMIDIDFFKGYNDYNGHLAGDLCLQVIAQAIKNSLQRPADFCARYGGEEFVVVMPDTDIAGAWHVLEKIRKAVVDLAIVNKFSQVAPVITLSSGYTTAIPVEGNSADEFFLNADKALYQAKYRGRNNIVFFADQSG